LEWGGEDDEELAGKRKVVEDLMEWLERETADVESFGW
jgi:hypothetical protein